MMERQPIPRIGSVLFLENVELRLFWACWQHWTSVLVNWSLDVFHPLNECVSALFLSLSFGIMIFIVMYIILYNVMLFFYNVNGYLVVDLIGSDLIIKSGLRRGSIAGFFGWVLWVALHPSSIDISLSLSLRTRLRAGKIILGFL